MKNIIILSLLILGGCETTSAAQKQKQEAAEEKTTNQSIVDNLTYHKDVRSNLCFAAYRHWYMDGVVETITNVPCTQDVEKLIKE